MQKVRISLSQISTPQYKYKYSRVAPENILRDARWHRRQPDASVPKNRHTDALSC